MSTTEPGTAELPRSRDVLLTEGIEERSDLRRIDAYSRVRYGELERALPAVQVGPLHA